MSNNGRTTCRNSKQTSQSRNANDQLEAGSDRLTWEQNSGKRMTEKPSRERKILEMPRVECAGASGCE